MSLRKINNFLTRFGIVLVVHFDGDNLGDGLFRFDPNGDLRIYLDWFSNHKRRAA